MLDSKEKKIDNIQSMEDTSGLNISQHPEYKRLSQELSNLAAELEQSEAAQARMAVDQKSSLKKSKALMAQLLDSEQQSLQLQE